jgi:hypothetical protein
VFPLNVIPLNVNNGESPFVVTWRPPPFPLINLHSQNEQDEIFNELPEPPISPHPSPDLFVTDPMDDYELMVVDPPFS